MFRPRERAFKQFKCPRPQCVKNEWSYTSAPSVWVVTTRSTCDMCRSRIKKWAERCKGGGGACDGVLQDSLTKLKWRADLEGHYKHQTLKERTEIWFYLNCLRNSPHLDTAASQLHATGLAVCSKCSAVPLEPPLAPPVTVLLNPLAPEFYF